MAKVSAFLQTRANDGLVRWSDHAAAAKHFNLSFAQVEEIALENGLLPARYQRNQQMFSTQQQLQLFHSRVAVVGCGGLGGYILEELARVGVGQLVAIDPDLFEEHNLNRQLFSSPKNLGRAKVQAVAQRIAEINPATTVTPQQVTFTKENAATLFSKVDVVADAVDNIPARLELSKACCEYSLPLVHGAIAGWYGHVTTIYPEDNSMEKIYQNRGGEKGVEQQLGNPSFTPAVVASFQVAEICKIILDRGELLRNRKLAINLLDMDMEEIPL